MEKSPNNVSSLHPLFALGKEIEQRGMIVAEGVNKLPVYGEPFISPYFVIALNLAGSCYGEYDMKPFEFRSQDMAVLFPNHTLLAQGSSEDYRVTLIVVSGSFYEQMQHRLTYDKSQLFHSQVQIHLKDEQFQCISDAFNFLKSVNKLGISRRKEIIADVMDMLSFMVDEFWQQSNKSHASPSGKYGLTSHFSFNRFYECLVSHYQESREVRYYAQKLCLSPKYFGSIIKQETGISAGEWIARYVIIQAKTLLRHRTDLTIQQISIQLGFPDAASFSRYFKTNAGMTAKEYRDQVLK